MDNLTQEDGAKLFQEKRYPEAAEAFRHLLRQELSAGLEADTRRRLSDTLASLGQTEEAAAERELAENIAEAAAGDPMALMTKGDILKRDNRHDEACAAYEQALRLLTPDLPPPALSFPAQPEPSRSYLMAKLAVAHYEASRPAKTVIWAGGALANYPTETIRLSMHRMCGVGYSSLGDLEKAEAHYFAALKLSKAGGKPQEIAQSLIPLASVQRKRGLFEAAIATARQAASTFAHPSRGALLAEVECLRDIGSFDEARILVAAMKIGPRYDRPDMEKRTQVILSLTLAWIEAKADDPEKSLAALKEAWAELGVSREAFPLPPPPSGGEDKLVLYCDATAVHLYAQLGRIQDSHQMQASVEARLSSFAQDRAGLMTIYSEFAPAAFVRGESVQSREWWNKYLECQPDPVGLVKAHFGLGKALLSLGETNAARDFLKQAVGPGIDSLDARRAQARLGELGG